MANLSERDAAVLQYLFNPLVQSPQQALVLSSQAKTDPLTKGLDEEQIPQDLLQQVKSLEAEGVKAALDQEYDQALQIFSQVIELVPNYSSSYNNRAQVYRLQKQYTQARIDLDRAIEISHPNPSEPPINANVAKLARAHRGFVLKLLGEDKLADEDLQIAAKLGHNLASLESNPFRTLCGQMVSVMLQEQCGVNV